MLSPQASVAVTAQSEIMTDARLTVTHHTITPKGGGMFGLRVTQPVLSWFFHTLLWFLLCYETDGTMLVGWGFK